MNPSFRFVHTADLHLDSPLKSLALRDKELANTIDGATRTALKRLVDLCINEYVDALLIAGDLYDGEQKSMHTAAHLAAQMRRLRDAQIPVFMIRGNHDAESRLTKELSLPDNVHVFTSRGGSKKLPEKDVLIHGVSFKQAHAPQSLLPQYKSPTPGCLNIGLLHTSLAGAEGHDEYAPCTLNELTDFGYDYWALGHVHKRAVHAQKPAVVMPGNPQGRDIGEAGPRTVSLVTLDSDGNASINEHTVGPAQFERVRVELTTQQDWSQLPELMEQSLRKVRDNVFADELIARIVFTGKSTLLNRLQRDSDLLLAEAREVANAIEHVWVEKISIREVSLPEEVLDSQQNDVLAQLAKIVDSQVLDSLELQALVNNETTALAKQLPQELRHVLGDSEEEQARLRKQLLREGSDWMLAQLQGEH